MKPYSSATEARPRLTGTGADREPTKRKQKGIDTMKPTKHATTNFNRIATMINGMSAENDHRRFTAGEGFMPLVIEFNHWYDYKGRPVYSMTHYYEQNGDLMRDPDMELAIDFEAGTVEPLTFRQDGFPQLCQQVYKYQDDGKLTYSPSLRTSLDDFLWHWLQNIEAQEYALQR